jgi:hypothetical protein
MREQRKIVILQGFFHKKVPVIEQNLKKPQKTCGNRRKDIDKVLRKDEGEMRYGSPQPHEHW